MTTAAARAAVPGGLLRAAAWLLASSASAQALRLASNLVLARLLAPETFGLMAAASTVYLGLVMLSDLGVWQSVVQRAEAPDMRFLGTAMSVQLLRAALLAAVVLAVAGVLAWSAAAGLIPPGAVFADPRLPWMIAGFALCALIQGGESMQLAIAQRELRAGELARLEISSQLVGTAVAVGFACLRPSPWALLAGALAAAAVRTALSHRLPGVRARPCWDAKHAAHMVGFGSWILLSSLIGFAASQGEKVILGSLLGAAEFGLLSIASTLLGGVLGLLSALNAHLLFPAFSAAVRRGSDDARAFYGRTQRLADLMLGTAAGLLAGGGHLLVHLLYDLRYAGAGWMLQVLAVGLIATRFQVLEQMMFAQGKAAYVTASNLLRALALAVLIPLCFRLFGPTGALWAAAGSQFAGWPVALLFKHRARLPVLAGEWIWPLALATGAAAGGALSWAVRA